MEKQLLKKLLNHEFYVNNKHRVMDDYFPSLLSPLWKTIQDAHNKYETDLTPTWVNQLFKDFNPQASHAAKTNVSNLLDDIEHEETPPDDLAADVLTEMYKKEKARQAAATAIAVINGEKSMGELIDFLDTFDRVDFTEDDNFEEIEFDINNILEFNSLDNLFPFRLSSMQERIPGAGRGHFIVVFARPEAGKTALAVYQAAGYLQQGLKVAYFANEESAKRVYLRLMCSALEKTEGEIRADIEGTKKEFKDTYAKNLAMIDGVGMGIEQIENWVVKNKPDVVFIDQLDKLSVKGAFNRGDERLGRLYTMAREMAKRHDLLMYGVTQCSAEGEGKTKLDYSMMAGSKTDKAAEADLIIGIGKRPQIGEEEMHRTIGISKNKINGWHGYFGSILDKYRGMYIE